MNDDLDTKLKVATECFKVENETDMSEDEQKEKDRQTTGF